MDAVFSDMPKLKRPSVLYRMASNHKEKICKSLEFINMDAFSSSPV